MLPYSNIRSTIVRGLRQALGVPVIQLNGGGDIPTGAFFTYNFPDGFGRDGEGLPITTQQDGKLLRQEAVTITVSFLSYADSVDDSLLNGLRARDWFKTAGYQALKALDVVVVEIGELQNLDINIEDEWERRQGFDVELRATDIVETPLETWIDEVNMTRE